jgi:chaperone modulatory protein CbpM
MAKEQQSTPEANFYLSLEEIITSYSVSTEVIIEIIDQGIITVDANEPQQWEFNSDDCRRIRMVLQLEKDLGVNVAGAGLVLELLEEIDKLNALLGPHRLR